MAKLTLDHIAPLALIMLRFVGASVLLVGLAAAFKPAGLPRPRGWDLARIGGLGVLGVALNQGLFIVGIHESTPARAALMYALSPLVVLGIGIFRGSEKPFTRRILGIVAALAGVISILSERGGLQGATLRGDLLLLGAITAWSLYTALAKGLIDKYGALQVTAGAMAAGCLVFAPIGIPAVLDAPLAQIPVSAWLGLAYLTVMMSVVGYFLWYVAVGRLPPSRVAVFMNLQPPLAIAASWLWFDEEISAAFLAGAVLVLVGVWAAQQTRDQNAEPA